LADINIPPTIGVKNIDEIVIESFEYRLYFI
jgi:hypothetical protein